jgi:hypothetical protein
MPEDTTDGDYSARMLDDKLVLVPNTADCFRATVSGLKWDPYSVKTASALVTRSVIVVTREVRGLWWPTRIGRKLHCGTRSEKVRKL